MPAPLRPLAKDLLAIGAREASEIEARFPKVQRRVGGYNLDALVPGRNNINLAHILVGSEGTLAFSTRIELALSPLLPRRAVGAVHFGSFYEAMNATQHIVRLNPIAVELMDRTMVELARAIPIFRPTLEKFVRGAPEAILLVEFGDDDQEDNLHNLAQLKELIGDLGFGWDNQGAKWGGVVEVLSPELQSAIADVRTSGLNIMMSMKEEGKPVSFVEDCAVPLEHLAAYTSELTELFAKHGTRGTWYAHAGAGCLHVRPILNLRQEKDVHAMREIAEAGLRHGALLQGLAFRRARRRAGALGIQRDDVRPAAGARLRGGERPLRPERPLQSRQGGAAAQVRRPQRCSATRPAIAARSSKPGSTGRPFPARARVSRARSRCATTTAPAASLPGGAMCPSYRVTRDERDVTRGRANTLRLAVTGQLGPDALASDEMAETLKLCVSCKACRRECPTGVDMARMKIEVLAARAKKHGLTLHDRLIGWLPRYAPEAARRPWLFNKRDGNAFLRKASQSFAGFSARRTLPQWRADIYRDRSDWAFAASGADRSRDVVLFADTFNRYFERENLEAAVRVLVAGGYRVHALLPADGEERPLCCGRTFLSVGQVGEAKREMERTLAALAPYIARGMPVIGLEPSCLFTFRDELPALIKGEAVDFVAANTLLLEEFLAREQAAGRLQLPLAPLPKRALLHGHCHQKAFDAMGAVESALRLIPAIEASSRSNRAAAAWPARSATTPTPSMSPSRWANCRCCRRCARRHPRR